MLNIIIIFIIVIITSLESEYLRRKSECEMLIGGDDIRNGVITLGTCFSMFVYICTCFCFTLIGRNLKAELTESHREIGRRNLNSRDVVASSPSLSHLAARETWRACSQAICLSPVFRNLNLFLRGRSITYGILNRLDRVWFLSSLS